MALERLQKLLARAGLGSRRACEEIITGGRVTVDGRVVAELGAKGDLGTQDVRVDGQRIRPEHPEYWLLNKPKGVVCTNFDPAGRRRPVDLMTQTEARLFPVGRLDADAKGLLVMTNDGEFANRLAHPRHGVPKTYVATVAGELTKDDMGRFVRGVWFAEGRARRAEVRLVKRGRSKSIVEVTIREGRNRQIRRLLAKLGHNVRELVRTRIGKIGLRGLSVGQSRRLSPEELEHLRRLPDQPPPERPRPAPKPPAQAGAERGKAPQNVYENRLGHVAHPPSGVQFRRQSLSPTRGAQPGAAEPQGFHTRDQRAASAPPPGAGGRSMPDKGRDRHPPREREWRREPGPEERGAAPEPPHPFQKKRGEDRRERPGRRDGHPEPSGRPSGPAGRREKRSPKTHDTDGAGKAGESHGRHAGRRGGGRDSGRGGPPRRGRRPHRRPPQ